VVLIATNDVRILIRGRIDADTNMAGRPVEELPAVAHRPGLVRLVAV